MTHVMHWHGSFYDQSKACEARFPIQDFTYEDHLGSSQIPAVDFSHAYLLLLEKPSAQGVL